MIILDAILETFVENLSKQDLSFIGKILIAISLIVLFLFIIIGSFNLGTVLLSSGSVFGILFYLLSIFLIIYFSYNFIKKIISK